MFNEEDFRKLKSIQDKRKTTVDELTHGEALFTLYSFSIIGNNQLIAPNVNLTELNELAEDLKITVKSILDKFDTNETQNLLDTLSHEELSLSQHRYSNDSGNDLLEKYHQAESTVFEEKQILLTDKFSISDLKKRNFIPYEYLIVISGLPPKSDLLSDVLSRYARKKVTQLETVIGKKIESQKEILEDIDKRVLKKLSAEYPLSLIAEAEYYKMRECDFREEYRYYSKKRYFNDDAHRQKVATRLKDRMLHAKFNTVDLEKISGVCRQIITSILKPKKPKKYIESKTLDTLATALGCTPDYLFCLSEFNNFVQQNKFKPLLKAITKTPDTADDYALAKRTGNNNASVIHKLIGAENILYLDDFQKIGNLIDNLMRQRKEEQKQLKEKRKKSHSDNLV